MKKFEITLQLEKVREANEKWRVALARKNADVEWMMRRLLHEAARAFMSPEEVAQASGYTVKRIRILMRAAGLDPRSGKNLLSKQAAETLAENAELMGVEPQHMDLTSPLAYLPMGEAMRRSLQDRLTTPTTARDVSRNLMSYEERSREELADTIYEMMPWEGETYQAVAEHIADALIERGQA